MSDRQPASRGPVVVDTGVFAAELLRRVASLGANDRPLLEGRRLIVSFVTAAEIRFRAAAAAGAVYFDTSSRAMTVS